ncbi:MAG: hypothetical protein IJU13_02100 [Bacteroidales bacterium]|nr:hypothetical protein [Bacteroidales bacterium]
MSTTEQIQIFADARIRTAWDDKAEKWYFSIVDVVAVLTDSQDYQQARNYWKVLKNRMRQEGNQSVTKCNQLKLASPEDGKRYLTDVADQEQLFRLIQSIPCKKAEPIKLWIAKVASERVDETVDPELAVNRAITLYRSRGYDDAWIKERLEQIQERKALTDEWRRVGVKELQFAVLTNDIYKAIADMSAKEYKEFKGLKGKANLRDNMTATENALTRIGEIATREISQNENPKTFEQSRSVARRGGGVARAARDELERQLGRSVISPQNAKSLRAVKTQPEEIDEKKN